MSFYARIKDYPRGYEPDEWNRPEMPALIGAVLKFDMMEEDGIYNSVELEPPFRKMKVARNIARQQGVPDRGADTAWNWSVDDFDIVCKGDFIQFWTKGTVPLQQGMFKGEVMEAVKSLKMREYGLLR